MKYTMKYIMYLYIEFMDMSVLEFLYLDCILNIGLYV